MKIFAERLHELRKERELSMDLLVDDLNARYEVSFHKSNVSRWEADASDPSLQHAKCIADYFDVSLDYMIGNTDSRLPSRMMAYARGLQK